MKKAISLSTIALLLLMLYGCGKSGSKITDHDRFYDGTYKIEVATDIYETPLAYCNDASGEMNINDYKISGLVVNDPGDKFYLSGTIDKSGTISAGLAPEQYGDNVAYYTGQFTATGGGGNWEDELGCHGKWTATKQ